MLAYIFFFIACSSTLAIGVYLLTATATGDIKENLHSTNDAAKSADGHSNISIQIFEYIEYHSILKQLCYIWYTYFKIIWKKIRLKLTFISRSIADISMVFQPKALVLLTWSIVLLCGCMLTLQIVIINFTTAITFEHQCFDNCTDGCLIWNRSIFFLSINNS